MCQTYRGGIEGGLESVPGLYKSLIEKKKLIEGKLVNEFKMSINGVLVNPIGTLGTYSSTVFRACFRYDNEGMGNPHICFYEFCIFFIDFTELRCTPPITV